MTGQEYEEYREKIRITEWRDGCVYRTESLGTGWFPQDVINGNLPRETSILYIAADDDFARTHMTIRRVTP